MKKYTLLIIAVFTATMFLTACSGEQKETTTTSGTVEQEETCKKDEEDKDKIICFNVSGGHESADYYIDQEDKTTAVLHFPYFDGGSKIVDINTTIDTISNGEPSEDAVSTGKYAYLTKWKLYHEFEQIRDTFSISCAGSSVDYGKGWTTRSAGYLEFDLNTLNEDGTFSVDLSYGYNHPKGNIEKVPTANAKCIGVQFGASDIDLSAYKGVSKNIWKGKITNMTSDGAEITIDNSCLYNSCNSQDGSKFQTIKTPITLYIKKGKGN